jgi:hypothetical protein
MQRDNTQVGVAFLGGLLLGLLLMGALFGSYVMYQSTRSRAAALQAERAYRQAIAETEAILNRVNEDPAAEDQRRQVEQQLLEAAKAFDRDRE